MKQKMYKFLDTDNADTRYELFDAVEVLNEQELRERCRIIINTFPKELVQSYQLNWIKSPIADIIDAFNEICDYDETRYFIVREITIDI